MDPYSKIGRTRAQCKDLKEFDKLKLLDRRNLNPNTLNALLEIIEIRGLGLRVVDG